jgi:hypothetical protein
MKPPVRQLGDEPWHYAPKEVRYPEQVAASLGRYREGNAASQGSTRDSAPPLWTSSRQDEAAPQNATSESIPAPWKRSKGQRPFVGNVATVKLDNKLALASNRRSGSPATSSPMKPVVRLAGLTMVMAIGIAGYKLGSGSPVLMPHQASGPSDQSGVAAEGRVQASHPLQSAPVSSAASLHAMWGQLKVGAIQAQQAGEPGRLTVSAVDAGADATVVIGGLAPGSTLSTGTQIGPNRWQLSVEELAGAVVTPPPGFIGTIDLTLELRPAGDTVTDRKSLRLEWLRNDAPASNNTPPSYPQPHWLDASTIVLMVKRGTGHMANGNIAAARMLFKPAAEASDPVAAFALAETYDPLVLRKLNAEGGVTADVGLAQYWYEIAKVLGSAVAPERLERLARLSE